MWHLTSRVGFCRCHLLASVRGGWWVIAHEAQSWENSRWPTMRADSWDVNIAPSCCHHVVTCKDLLSTELLKSIQGMTIFNGGYLEHLIVMLVNMVGRHVSPCSVLLWHWIRGNTLCCCCCLFPQQTQSVLRVVKPERSVWMMSVCVCVWLSCFSPAGTDPSRVTWSSRANWIPRLGSGRVSEWTLRLDTSDGKQHNTPTTSASSLSSDVMKSHTFYIIRWI